MKTKFVIFIAIFAVLSSLFVLPSFADDSASDVDLTQYNTFTFNETVSCDDFRAEGPFTIPACPGVTFDDINLSFAGLYLYYGDSYNLYIFDFTGSRVFSDPEFYVLYFDSISLDSYNGLLEFGTFSYTDLSAEPETPSDPEVPSDPEADTPVKANWYKTLYDIIHNGIYGGEELDSDQTFMCSFLATILSVLTFCFPFFLLFFILKLILSN